MYPKNGCQFSFTYFSSSWKRKDDSGHLCLCYPVTTCSLFLVINPQFYYGEQHPLLFSVHNSVQKFLLLAPGLLEQYCSGHCDLRRDRGPIRRNEMQEEFFLDPLKERRGFSLLIFRVMVEMWALSWGSYALGAWEQTQQRNEVQMILNIFLGQTE